MKVQYQLKVNNIRPYKLSDSGEIDGTFEFDQNGTWAMKPMSDEEPIYSGSYTVIGNKLELVRDPAMTSAWAQSNIRSIASQQGLSVIDFIRSPSGNCRSKISSPKITFIEAHLL